MPRSVSPFLRERAERLSRGEPSAAVMRDLRAHYTTPCARRNKVSLLRTYFAERFPSRLGALDGVRITPEERRECKRGQREATGEKQRRVVRVDGDAVLAQCAGLLEAPASEGETRLQQLARVAVALLAVTGRRTAELLNGRSSFRAVRGRPHECVFAGQLKTRGERGAYRIPLLLPFADVKRGFERLRRLQRGDDARAMDNARVSSRYQRPLSRALAAAPGPLSTFSRLHELRAFYACAAYEAFEVVTGGGKELASQREAVRGVLGHASLSEASKYTGFRVTVRRRLGEFALDAPDALAPAAE